MGSCRSHPPDRPVEAESRTTRSGGMRARRPPRAPQPQRSDRHVRAGWGGSQQLRQPRPKQRTPRSRAWPSAPWNWVGNRCPWCARRRRNAHLPRRPAPARPPSGRRQSRRDRCSFLNSCSRQSQVQNRLDFIRKNSDSCDRNSSCRQSPQTRHRPPGAPGFSDLAHLTRWRCLLETLEASIILPHTEVVYRQDVRMLGRVAA